MRLLWWRRRKLSEGEFLRLVMRSVTYDGRDIELRPPRKTQHEEVAARAMRTTRELIKMVK